MFVAICGIVYDFIGLFPYIMSELHVVRVFLMFINTVYLMHVVSAMAVLGLLTMISFSGGCIVSGLMMM